MNKELLGILLIFGSTVLLAVPLGRYLATIYRGDKSWTDFLVPFERLLTLGNSLILAVFTVVDLALWRVRRHSPPADGFNAPSWAPLAAAVLSLALMATALLL